jgi:replicative DNA helicase
MIDKSNLPPHDEVAEAATLGSMMLANKTINEVIQLVKSQDFYYPKHQFVFDAIVSLFTRGEPVDALTVGDELTTRKQIRQVGGAVTLIDMISNVPTPTSANYYAKIVSQKSKLRRLAEVGSFFQRIAFDAGDDGDEAIVMAEKYFREIQQPTQGGVNFGSLVRDWRTWQDSPEDIISTPWPELNNYLGGGMRRGKLYVVGGRPGSGKSMAGLNMAAHVAEKEKLPTIIFSMEMVANEVASRLLAAGAWANYGEIFRKRMSGETIERVNDYIDSHSDLNLEVFDRASITVEEIVGYIRAHKPACAFIDYCQLIAPSDSKIGRREQVDHITRSLKVCAADTGCAIILASQVNRGPATGNRMPTIADLRESGGIENDADVVLLLHREDEGAGSVKLNVGKNRDGKLGTIEFIFRGDVARIGN